MNPLMVEETPKPKLWEQQPGESPLLYSYFEIYKDLPTQIRTVKKVHETLKSKGKNLHPHYVLNLSSEHQWKKRVSAYDRHMSLVKADERAGAIREMEHRHASIGEEMIDKIMDTVDSTNLGDMEPNKKAYFLDAVSRALGRMIQIERLSRGESTSHIKKTQEGIDRLIAVVDNSRKSYLKNTKGSDNNKSIGEVIDADFKVKEKE